jgi:GT2 family glycosyltransferase
MPSLSDITVVSVTYNSTGVLRAMLESLPDAVKVVVVDNGSGDAEQVQVLCEAHGARALLQPTNRGFGIGCNVGAAAADTRYLLFLNPDTVVRSGAFEALLTAADRYPNASAFNPLFLDRSGNPMLRRRSNLRPKNDKYRGPMPSGDMEIPVLSGAAIFLEAKAFQKIGGFDEQIFLYHEDDDLALRLQQQGPLMHVHDAVVQHLEGRSSTRSPATAHFKAYHMARSRVYCRAKHQLPWPNAGAILRGLIQLMSPVMLVPRNRAKNWGFLKGAISSLRDGGRYEG